MSAAKRLWLLPLLVGCSVAQGEPPSDASLAKSPAPALAADAPKPLRVHAKTLQFHAAPNLPKGTEIAVLEGDPARAGIFTIRLKAKPGFLLPPHTHPADERVTVIAGSLTVGLGTDASKREGAKFVAGDFYINPPGFAHYVFSDEGAIIQITGVGPWKVEPVR